MSSSCQLQLSLPATSGHTFSYPTALPLVLYFTPKDNTPGCTESMDFRMFYADLPPPAAGIRSRDRSSRTKTSRPNIPAARSDQRPDEIALRSVRVMKLKNMYGKQVRGIERSTFVLGEVVAAREWRGVKCPQLRGLRCWPLSTR